MGAAKVKRGTQAMLGLPDGEPSELAQQVLDVLLTTRSGLQKPIAPSRGCPTRNSTLSASGLAGRTRDPETTVAAVIGEALRATGVQKILLDTPVLLGR